MKPNKVFIIAEAGVNHNGNIDMAIELIRQAHFSGADAVKFQTFKTKNLVSKNAKMAEYQMANTKESNGQFEMLKKLELSEEDHFLLKNECQKLNIEFLSTPFDEESLKFLNEKLDLSILKIPSGEITNAPLLLNFAKTKKKLILSTGMSNLLDIQMALSVIAFGLQSSNSDRPSQKAFKELWDSKHVPELVNNHVSILHCTTEYPAPINEINLKAMNFIHQYFNLPVGYSDHTLGIEVPIAAVALGATIIEKHFTLDKTLPGPDHKASLNPVELKEMVKSIRNIEMALGTNEKICSESERKNIAVARKSLVAKTKINKGDIFSNENLTTKRPGTGLSPYSYWDYCEKVSLKDYNEDDLIDE